MRTRYKRDSVYVSQAAKQRMYSAILWQAVFGKEDLMHTLYQRTSPKPGWQLGVNTNAVRSKA